MAKSMSRRQFLRADFRARHSVLRPPWAIQEDAFVERCTRCGDCVRICPQAILGTDAAGFPAVDFTRGACSFCAACAGACASGALTSSSLSSPATSPPWQAKAVIDDRCLAQRGVCCEVCRDQCAARALQFRPAVGRVSAPRINVSACNGCGACVGACPTHAIRIIRPADADRGGASIIQTVEVSCT
jgi:ferredoxin-type protein NapF